MRLGVAFAPSAFSQYVVSMHRETMGRSILPRGSHIKAEQNTFTLTAVFILAEKNRNTSELWLMHAYINRR